MTNLVSIIIPVYNGSNYLQEAIDSALAQTYKNIEIIVVNDGSSDKGATEKIIKSYGNKIRYYKKKNGGVSSALNIGIKNMKGEWFSWLSHDDIYYPNKISSQLEYLDMIKKEAVIYTDYVTIDESSEHLKDHHLPHIKPENFRYELIENSFVHGCSLLIPKTLLLQIGSFSKDMATTQDYYQWFQIANIIEFHHLPRILIKSRIHTDQGTQTMSSQVRNDKDILNTYFLTHLKKEEILTHEHSLSEYYRRKSKEFVNRRLYGASMTALKLAIISGGVQDIFVNLYQLTYFILATLKLKIIYHE